MNYKILIVFFVICQYILVNGQYEGIFGKDKDGNVQFFKVNLPTWMNNVDTNSFSNVSISKISSLVNQEDCAKCIDQICRKNETNTMCLLCELKYVYNCNNNKKTMKIKVHLVLMLNVEIVCIRLLTILHRHSINL